jgi:hypothetical protein
VAPIVVTPGTASGLSWGGEPLEVWGVRVASAAAKDEWTEDLVGHLDEYLSYGINTLTVFYQGSSGGSVQAFSPDGRQIDPGVQRRMERIIEAAAERRMPVVAGVFYQAQVQRLDPENGAWLAERAAYPRAVEAVGRALRRYDNVLINVCNEHTVRNFEACPFPMRTVEGIVELCQAAKQAAPEVLAGGGGGHGHDGSVNAELVARPEVEVLFWDAGQHSPEAVAAYRRVHATKPLMNVEVFGARAQGFVEMDESRPQNTSPHRGAGEQALTAWPGGSSTMAPLTAGRTRVQGVFPEGESAGNHRGKADFLAEIAYAAQVPGFSLFGHFPAWFQGISRAPNFVDRFDLGGQGTLEDPGIRWYFEAVARLRGLAPGSV